METKKMRQMAYKKKLEEEYREFQERCKVRLRRRTRDWESSIMMAVFSTRKELGGTQTMQVEMASIKTGKVHIPYSICLLWSENSIF